MFNAIDHRKIIDDRMTKRRIISSIKCKIETASTVNTCLIVAMKMSLNKNRREISNLELS